VEEGEGVEGSEGGEGGTLGWEKGMGGGRVAASWQK